MHLNWLQIMDYGLFGAKLSCKLMLFVIGPTETNLIKTESKFNNKMRMKFHLQNGSHLVAALVCYQDAPLLLLRPRTITHTIKHITRDLVLCSREFLALFMSHLCKCFLINNFHDFCRNLMTLMCVSWKRCVLGPLLCREAYHKRKYCIDIIFLCIAFSFVCKVWDEITYPFLNFNGETVEI